MMFSNTLASPTLQEYNRAMEELAQNRGVPTARIGLFEPLDDAMNPFSECQRVVPDDEIIRICKAKGEDKMDKISAAMEEYECNKKPKSGKRGSNQAVGKSSKRRKTSTTESDSSKASEPKASKASEAKKKVRARPQKKTVSNVGVGLATFHALNSPDESDDDFVSDKERSGDQSNESSPTINTVKTGTTDNAGTTENAAPTDNASTHDNGGTMDKTTPTNNDSPYDNGGPNGNATPTNNAGPSKNAPLVIELGGNRSPTFPKRAVYPGAPILPGIHYTPEELAVMACVPRQQYYAKKSSFQDSFTEKKDNTEEEEDGDDDFDI